MREIIPQGDWYCLGLLKYLSPGLQASGDNLLYARCDHVATGFLFCLVKSLTPTSLS